MKKFKNLSLFLSLLLLLSVFTGCLQLSSTGGAPTQESSTVQETETVPPIAEGSSFAVHFIDVGQADSALVICDGKTMLIDGGNAPDSNLIYSYLQKQGITHLDYVICTHAHEDHVGGLAGALSYATAGKVMAPVTEYSTKAFQSFVQKAADRGCSVTVPKAGDSFALGSAAVTVVGPLKTYEETNDTSIVLRIVYGEVSFLFTGDMERTAEADLLDAGVPLRSTVLKVGHHGSSTSTSYLFLREVAPDYAVISVGADNDYGHPTDEVLSRLRDAEVTLYRTDLQGDIICTSNGKTVTFTTARNNGISTNPTEKETSSTSQTYIGNKNSHVFHLPTCSSLPMEANRITFASREEAVSANYTPCSRCDP